MESTHQLLSRATCYYDRYGYRRCGNFYTWGRWVVAGVVIFIVLFFALVCCCLARRRRKRGTKPYYGTGWMAPTGGKFGVGGQNNGYGNNNQMHNYNQGGYNQGGYNQGGYNQGSYNGPPAYGQQTQPQTYDGYYGQQQYGNVQAPPATYQQQGVYSPPPVPPPGK